MGCSSSSDQRVAGQAGAGSPRSCPGSDSAEGPVEGALSVSSPEYKLMVRHQDGVDPPPPGADHGVAGTSSMASIGSGSSVLSWRQSWRTKSSVDSQLQYSSPNQTIIIYDWDDTLCPSRVLRHTTHFDSKGRLAGKIDEKVQEELNLLVDQVLPLLRRSMMMGKVVIVTNATRPWVEVSCHNFLPALKAVLKNIPVIYAMELLKEARPQSDQEAKSAYLTATKARAMQAAVSNFYSRYPKQSWKNILSIGDAFFEHDAIRQVVRERPTQKRCRTKTIKLLENPTIAGMVVQLSIVRGWLDKIVQLDNDIDIDMSSDEATMDKWISLFGA